MNNNIKINRNQPTSVADQIHDQICRMVLSGELRAGEKLPPLRELQEKLEVGICTIRQAFDRLAREGFITKKPHLGTFINSSPEEKTSADNNYSCPGLMAGILVDYTCANSRTMNFIEEFELKINSCGGQCRLIKYDQRTKETDIFARLEKVDSILCTEVSVHNDPFLKRIQDLNKPMVVYNYYGKLKLPKVEEDWDWAMRLLMGHLIDLGHRRIALASFRWHGRSKSSYRWVADREAAFLDMAKLETLKLGPSDIYKPTLKKDGSLENAGKEIFSKVFKKRKKYSALIGINDSVAIGAYKQAAKLGLKIPEELSVAGFDNITEAQELEITTIMHSSREDGRSAAELLMDLFRNPRFDKLPHIINKPAIIKRHSTTDHSK